MRKRKAINREPWRSLWTSPRATMQAILGESVTKWILWFAVISGALDGLIGVLLVSIDGMKMNATPMSGLFILFFLITGIIFGIVQLYVGGWLLKLTGSWLGGQGSYAEVKCAVGWSMYPLIITNLVFILGILLLRYPVIEFFFSLLHFALLVWTFVILCKVLAEAHRFSSWRSLAAIVLAGILIFIVVFLVSNLIPMISPLFIS